MKGLPITGKRQFLSAMNDDFDGKYLLPLSQVFQPVATVVSPVSTPVHQSNPQLVQHSVSASMFLSTDSTENIKHDFPPQSSYDLGTTHFIIKHYSKFLVMLVIKKMFVFVFLQNTRIVFRIRLFLLSVLFCFSQNSFKLVTFTKL